LLGKEERLCKKGWGKRGEQGGTNRSHLLGFGDCWVGSLGSRKRGRAIGEEGKGWLYSDTGVATHGAALD